MVCTEENGPIVCGDCLDVARIEWRLVDAMKQQAEVSTQRANAGRSLSSAELVDHHA
jgi:hypothetical protein